MYIALELKPKQTAMYYIRFTNDISRDIESGSSSYFTNGKKLNGLCAWSISEDLSPYASKQEIIEAAHKTAQNIAKNTYCGYSSNSEFAVLEGSCVGSGNDGVLINVEKVISIESL